MPFALTLARRIEFPALIVIAPPDINPFELILFAVSEFDANRLIGDEPLTIPLLLTVPVTRFPKLVSEITPPIAPSDETFPV